MQTTPDPSSGPVAPLVLPRQSTAVKIALAYAIAGVVWIFFSGWGLHLLVEDSALEARFEVLKGWTFVGVTALLLWLVLSRYFHLIQRSGRLLQESETRWKQALEGSSQAVWDCDFQTGEVFYSAEWKAMLGYMPDEIGSRLSEWESRVHPADLPAVRYELSRHLDGQTPVYVSEHRLRCKDGSYRWVSDQGKVTSRGPDGAAIRMVGTHFDIDRRRQAEERSRLQHDLALALAAATDLEDGLRLCLQAAMQVDGRTCGGFYLCEPGGALSLRVHSERAPEFAALPARFASGSAQARAAALGSPVYGEFGQTAQSESAAPLDGGLRSLAMLPIQSQGQVLGCLMVASHTQNEMPAALRSTLETIAASAGEAIGRLQAQSELRRWADAFEHCAHGIALGQPTKNQVMACNPALARMLGRPIEEITGEKILNLYVPEDHARLRLWMEEADRTGSIRYESRMVRADGTTFPVQMDVVSVRGADGRPIYRVATVQDISERKQAEGALRESEQQLRLFIDHAPVSLAMFDRGMRYLAYSRRWLQDFGRGLPNLNGRSHYELYPDLPEHWLAAHQRGLAGETVKMDQERIEWGGAAPQWLSWTVRPWRDGSGAIGGIVIFSEDITRRRQGEDALRRSEAHVRTLVDTLPDLVWLKDPQGVYLACNARFEAFMGLPEAEILGKTDYDFAHRHLADFFRANDMAAIAAGGPRMNEEEATFVSDGHREILETVKTPMYDADGTLIGVLGIGRDITGRKQAEQALRRSEEQVRLKLDSILSPDIEVGDEELVNLLDIPALQSLMDHFSELSHAVVAIVDTRGKVLLRSGWQDICTQFHRIHPDSARNCTESDLALARSIRPGEHVGYHCRNGLWDVVTPLMIGGKHVGNIFTGQFFYEDDAIDEAPFALQAERYGYDQEAYLCALRRVPRVSREWVATLMVFLTEFAELISRSSFSNLKLAKALVQQKRVEGALRESEDHFRAMFETASIGVAQTDPESGRWLRVNRRMCEITGYSTAELLEMRVGDITHPDDRLRDRELFDSVVRGDVPEYRIEKRYIRKDGLTVWVNVNMTLIRDRDGQPMRTMATVEDITERKRADEEREKLQGQLAQAQKMESIGILAGGVAHDFNNLLTVINGYTELALSSLPPADPLQVQLTEVRKAGDRATGLTRQLLAFSRKQVLQPRTLSLNGIVQNMKKLLERLVGEDVHVCLTLSEQDPIVHADPGQLEQVIMNLAINARDAMTDGGRLSIETAVVCRDESHLGDNPEARPGRYAVLAISDAGAGMDEATVKRVFEPFFTTKPVGQGTGLGLSMVHGIVAQSGGHIEVHSQPGKGTTFTVFLPAAAAAEEAVEAPPAVAQPVRGNETILVVEDQAEVRDFTAAVLKARGYRVLKALSGSEALQVLEREAGRVDLVLTDVVMPNMSGRQLVERVHLAYPEIQALYMSGYTDDVIAHHGILEEGVNLIQKPFSPEALAAKVRECLGPLAAIGRILVVDDERAVRSFLRTVLETAGYAVFEAEEGKQALAQAEAEQIDLVVTDLVMPGQEGMETIQALRRQLPGAGIIAISGASGGRYLQMASMLGADAVLDKPVAPRLLLTRVAEVLERLRR